MKRLLLGLGAAVAMLAALAALAFPWLESWMMSVPATAFADTPLPPPPDYADRDSWAALPDRADSADWLPRDSAYRDHQAEAVADVFYVHPTAAFYGKYWVAAMDNRLARINVDLGIIPQQATAFNAAGRVFAPRYRSVRMAIWTAADRASVTQATALAYADVKAAFHHFLEHWNDGRPLILASHSQGTLHLLRLLQEEFDGQPLAQRLIAAYLVGNTVAPDALQLPVCATPDQTGCFVSWNTVLAGGDSWHWVGEKGLERIVCVNPLSWQADEAPIPAAANQGAIPMIGLGLLRQDIGPLYAQVAGARCGREGVLWIDQAPAAPGFSAALFENGTHYHTYDLNLFYASIRQNALARTRAYLARRQTAKASPHAAVHPAVRPGGLGG